MIIRILLITLCCLSSLHADSWRILFYMDASEKLADMAFKNITDMMRGAPDDNITLMVQLHAYYNVALRYQVTKDGLHFDQEVALTGDSAQDLINASAWAFNDCNADHTMLILSDHGWGILDPRWSDSSEQWVINADGDEQSCPIRARLIHQHKRHRGYIFNATSHTYLTNDDLINSLETITTTILKSKIDLLAFDTCMGAMLEVAYQVAPYASYMVGCQSCALTDGFDYQGIMQVLNNDENNAPLAVAQGMVRVFDTYYQIHDDAGIYTHAAYDLSCTQGVIDALNGMVEPLMRIDNIVDIVTRARSLSPRFCMWPIYTDTVEFCNLISNELSQQPATELINHVQNALQRCITAHRQFIVAHCGGSRTHGVAHGSAIYCPFNYLERSYATTLFAQQCLWFDLLKMVCSDAPSDGQEWTVM